MQMHVSNLQTIQQGNGYKPENRQYNSISFSINRSSTI